MLTSLTDIARDQRGFTLIEALVAIAAGSVVCVALVTMLLFVTKQQATLSSVVQANQLSRTAMTKIVDELHSACLGPSFAPVREKSSNTELRFVNAYSEAPVISESKAEAYEHRIKWTESTGQLIDETYPPTGGSWPNFAFSKTASSTTILANNVTLNKSGGKSVPMFQYYPYTTSPSSTSESALSMLQTKALAVPLTSSGAGEAAGVLIDFKTAVGLKGNEEERPGGRVIELSDLVTLAFSAPKSESSIVDGPCQ